MNKFDLFLRKALQTAKSVSKRQLGNVSKKQLINMSAALFMAVAVTNALIPADDIEVKAGTEQSDIVLADVNTEAPTVITDYDEPELSTSDIESVNINLLMDALTVEEQTESEDTATYGETTENTQTEVVSQPVVSYTEEDYNNLLRIVEAEATGADVMAKIMVANVIINRVNSYSFPNTITEVIYQGNGIQFQPIMDGRFYSVTVTASTIEAVNRALYGEDYSQGAYFFASTASVNAGGWHATALTRLFEYGGHVYFTF